MKQNLVIRLWACVAAFGLLLAAGNEAARADVVTYNDGRIVKGIVEEMPGNPDFVALSSDMGRITIPKSRIKEIKKESKAMGYVRIGEAMMEKGKYDEAITQALRAIQLEPANTAAETLKAQAEAKLAEQNRQARTDALGQIDKLGRQARDLIQRGEFDKAEKMLVEANKLLPDNDQKKRLATLISELYLAWATERADKYDQIGAEEKLNLALAANPNNDKVIEKMLKLWENDPQRWADTARVYETILTRHPEDRALEINLANLYYTHGRVEDATRHYLNIFKSSPEYKGTIVEKRLVDSIDRLQRQYAMKKDYDRAIHYFDILMELAPKKANPSEKLYYMYYQKAMAVKPNDFAGQFNLASYAETQGLDQEALNLYRSLVKVSPPAIQAKANAGITRYALKSLADAQEMFDKGNYTLAKTMADSLRREYPSVTSIQEKVAELIGKAQAEEVKEQRTKRELAKAVLSRADDFFNTAYYHYQNLFSTERRNIPTLISDRTMAKRYFQLAVDAYIETLRIDPTLGTSTNSIVNVRLNDAKEFIARLNLRPAPMAQSFGRVITSESDGSEDNY